MAIRLSTALDDERSHIAHELHDGLGQTLASVQIRLGEIETAETLEARRAIVGEISRLVIEAIHSSRNLTAELMAPVMPEVGIEGELERLATGLTERHGIPCLFMADSAPKPLTREVATTVVRAARELLFNIKKHARAEKASLVVERTGHEIEVTVCDDGIGFRPCPESQPERVGFGFGLLIVRERLAEIGGDIEIDPKPGNTRIVITAPLLESVYR